MFSTVGGSWRTWREPRHTQGHESWRWDFWIPQPPESVLWRRLHVTCVFVWLWLEMVHCNCIWLKSTDSSLFHSACGKSNSSRFSNCACESSFSEQLSSFLLHQIWSLILSNHPGNNIGHFPSWKKKKILEITIFPFKMVLAHVFMQNFWNKPQGINAVIHKVLGFPKCSIKVLHRFLSCLLQHLHLFWANPSRFHQDAANGSNCHST